MSEIPDDIMNAARILTRAIPAIYERSEHNLATRELIAAALMAERERCVAIASGYASDLRHGDRSRFTAAHIAGAIRAQSEK